MAGTGEWIRKLKVMLAAGTQPPETFRLMEPLGDFPTPRPSALCLTKKFRGSVRAEARLEKVSRTHRFPLYTILHRERGNETLSVHTHTYTHTHDPDLQINIESTQPFPTPTLSRNI